MSRPETWPTNTSPDSPERTAGTVDPTGGYARYIREARHLLKTHTGSPEQFLSAQEEYDLAETIQLGRAAQAELEILDMSQEAERLPLIEQASAGRHAKQKLIECNLVFAAYCARLSMNFHRIEDEDPNDPRIQARLRHKPGDGNLRRLKSRYAVLDDRVQIANLALVKAADSFLPRRHPSNGKPIYFRTYARYQIQRDLELHARFTEPPGWKIGSLVLGRFYQAQKHPEGFTPEDRERLALLNEGRDTVSLEEIMIDDMNDHSTDTSSLTFSEIVPATEEVDPTSDHAIANLLANRRAEVLRTMISELPEMERQAIQLYYGNSLTLEGVARHISGSRQRQQQRIMAGLRKLRHPSRSRLLKELTVDEAVTLTSSPRTVSDLKGAVNIRTGRRRPIYSRQDQVDQQESDMLSEQSSTEDKYHEVDRPPEPTQTNGTTDKVGLLRRAWLTIKKPKFFRRNQR